MRNDAVCYNIQRVLIERLELSWASCFVFVLEEGVCVCMGSVLLNFWLVFVAVVLSIKSDVIEIQYQYINIYTYLIYNTFKYFRLTAYLRRLTVFVLCMCICEGVVSLSEGFLRIS